MPKNQVVVAYDFSESGRLALADAIELGCRAPDNVLHFLTVLDGSVEYRDADTVQQDLVEHLRGVFEGRTAAGEVDFFVHARIGEPVGEILRLAEEVGADLVILGSHGRTGVRRLLLGSVSEAVLRKALCPVLVSRAKGYPDVVLEKVVEVPSHALHYKAPHRYSYSSSAIVSRPADWPLR